MLTPTAEQLLIAGLTAGGYHGLFRDDIDCACQISDLMPCGMSPDGCHAGWRQPPDGEEFRIGPTKPATTADLEAAGQQRLFNEEESE